jgi:hypothetical protein
MFESGSDEGNGFDEEWQPEGWNLPDEDAPAGPDAFSGVDPDLLPPTDEVAHEHETEIISETDPEVVRTAVRTQCLVDINEYLVTAQSQQLRFFSFNNKSEIVREMISEAVHDDDATAVAAHSATLETLPSASSIAKFEAQFASAILGDPAAAVSVHHALEAEQINSMPQRQGSAEHSGLNDPLEPLTPLHNAVINRCVDYGVPADHWIDMYAVDPEDRFAKLAHYLHLRIDAAGADVDRDRAALQQAFDEHMTHVVDLPPAFTTGRIPLLLERTSSPAVRTQLVDRFIADTQKTPLSLESFRDTMRVGRTMLDDPLLATEDRHRFFAMAQHQYGQMLMKSHTYASVMDASYPFTEARMHYRGAEADEIIRNIDKLAEYTFQSVRGGTEWDMKAVVASRDARLSSSAYRFAVKGEFDNAHLLLSAMSPGAAQQSMWAECFEMARTAADPQALQVDEMTLAVEPMLGLHHEVATLRIAGNVEELIAQATNHVRAIRELDAADDSRDSGARRSDNAMHLEYVNAACGAIGRLDSEQFLVAAKRLLPELRNLSGPVQLVKFLSEALIVAGDASEPTHALEYINRVHPRLTQERMEALWELAKILRRANEAV